MTELEIQHDLKVQEISRQLKQFYKQNKKIRIYHGTTNSTRTQKFQKDSVVYTTFLNNIISVHVDAKYVIVEPNVPMDQLVKETCRYGLVPPVVMEFPGITVGGGIQGGAGESSSFKWGGLHQCCLEYEMVLGNGEIRYVNSKQYADLFWGTACSYGSLGVITQVKLRLIPAKPFVYLTYTPTHSFSESIHLLEKKGKNSIDFIDAILFSKNSGVVMTGKFSEKTDRPVVTFRKAHDNWFYIHAENKAKKNEIQEELIPLGDYLFRYNRGAFWTGRYAFQKLNLPFNRITRFFFNPLMKTRTLYRFLHAINISQGSIVQDLCLPKETTIPFLKFIDKTIPIYPLWLCSGIPGNAHEKLSPGYLKTDLVIDIGVWGKIKGDFSYLLQLNRDLEKMLQKLNGRKVLYAHQYYSRNEFWKIYDEKWYTDLRKKYYADRVFPDIYEKTKVSGKYSVSIVKGLIDVIKSPFMLPLSK